MNGTEARSVPLFTSILCNLMQFPIKIGRRWQIQIPKNIREYLGLKEGDGVLVDIVKKDSIEAQKRNLEKPYRKGD